MKLKYIEHADGRIQKAPRRTCTDKAARMQRAKGPGSMDCENEIRALSFLGRWREALDLYDKHRAMRGVRMGGMWRVWEQAARQLAAAR